MNKEETICKNCKYHYIEEISFDYPQSCCSKRQCTTEQWCKCYGFEYSDRYIKQLQKENKKQKEVIDKAIKYINKCENIKAYYEYIDEDGYDEYNYDEDFKKKLLDILKEVKTC